jgi:hypothetical protein
MRIQHRVWATATAFLLLLPCSGGARAEDDNAPPVFQKTVPAEVMGAQRGRAVLTIMDVDGNVQDNAAINNITGRNVITSGAFANASGLSTAIQNSGNNVLIQNATILQLDLR